MGDKIFSGESGVYNLVRGFLGCGLRKSSADSTDIRASGAHELYVPPQVEIGLLLARNVVARP